MDFFGCFGHLCWCMQTTTPLEWPLTQKPAESPPEPVRYCLYARKSTEQDEMQALSIDSQIKEMAALAVRDGLQIVEVKRESHSAKETGQRPVFNEIIDDIITNKYDGLLTWATDRIARNAGDLGKVIDLMDAGVLREIRTFNQKFTNNPNEKFLLMILGSQAKLENDNKRINVKRGLRTRAEMGLLPGVAPIGYLNDKRRDHKCEMTVDPYRSAIVKEMFEKSGYQRWSGRKIYAWLKEVGFTTRNNKPLSVSNVYTTLKNPFYCGMYEYPRGSGNWYTGKHTPLISRELYEMVQQKLLEDHKPKHTEHNFTFTRMMVCGECGSGLTGLEKTKTLKTDGSTRTYVYYMCTKGKGLPCSNPYIREDRLIEQLSKMIDQIELNEIGARHLIAQEVERYNRLQAIANGGERIKAKEMDVRKYAKYLLQNGTVQEKRDLLQHVRGKMVVRDQKIDLATSNPHSPQ